MRPHFPLAAALACVLTSSVAATQDQAAFGLRRFATELAHRGVAAGVVAEEGTFGVANGTASNEPSAEGLETLLGRFNAAAAHKIKAAADPSGTVHVRATDEPASVRDLVENQLIVPEARTISVRDAVFRRVIGALRGQEPQAMMGTGLVPGPDCPLDKPIRLSGNSTSLLGALDEIVKQAPGLVWLVTYDPVSPVPSARVGVLCPDGVALRMEVYP
jgi:hypothetical protein